MGCWGQRHASLSWHMLLSTLKMKNRKELSWDLQGFMHMLLITYFTYINIYTEKHFPEFCLEQIKKKERIARDIVKISVSFSLFYVTVTTHCHLFFSSSWPLCMRKPAHINLHVFMSSGKISSLISCLPPLPLWSSPQPVSLFADCLSPLLASSGTWSSSCEYLYLI